MESVNYTNQTFQENKELRMQNETMKTNLDILNKQMTELYDEQEKNEKTLFQKVYINLNLFIFCVQIQKLNKINEDLQNEKEKLEKLIESNEKDYKNSQSYSYQEHFKKMFLKFIEQAGHKF